MIASRQPARRPTWCKLPAVSTMAAFPSSYGWTGRGCGELPVSDQWHRAEW
jgi:hypothetical protein